MSIFVDKKFDQMDWISQAVEPYEVHVNSVLSKLPNYIVVKPADIRSTGRGTSLQINKESVLNDALKQLNIDEKWPNLSWDERHLIYDSFAFDLIDSMEIDFRLSSTDIPIIKLNKIKFCLEEEQARQIITGVINDSQHVPDRAKHGFVLELAKLFVSKSKIDTKINDTSRGRYRIAVLISLIYSEYVIPSGRLRSDHVAIAFTKLIANYALHGQEHTLAEIMRIKMMMDNGQAIYTIGDSTNV